jgi:alkanesulfonate monooxygenase SsuD/methylene tetrahydromethanopterin reductase-like flavin-dependent oxidoreductase (luciferase family)
VEELRFSHVLAYDRVVGADPPVHIDWSGPYDLAATFHEPLLTYGYLAAVTTSLELVTGVIILPQRQAVLVAKQAAEVDLLSGGRLRLGVGVSWNAVEYEALGEDFTNGVADALRSWADAGATHVSVNTMGAGLRSVDEHLTALAEAAEAAKTITV